MTRDDGVRLSLAELSSCDARQCNEWRSDGEGRDAEAAVVKNQMWDAAG